MKNLSSPATNFISEGLIFSFLFLVPLIVEASEPLSIVINEIAWMGTKVEGVESKNWWRYEWIELYNNSGESISLNGWKIELYRSSLDWSLELKGEIPSRNYFLIVSSEKISPNYDLNYSNLGGKFNNNGQKVLLSDGSGRIIDEVNCYSFGRWFAGDNETKQTMERKNPSSAASTDNWRTSQNSGGTPKAENSVFAETEVVDVKPQQPQTEPEPKEEEPKPIIYPAGIVINEILPSPEGPDEKDEWIEIFNQNNFEVDVSNWEITDIAGKTETYAFPQITKIPGRGFLVLSRPESKITLNNDEDGLLLIQPNGNILDNVNYQKALRGQSYNKAESNWVWSPVLTPASKNILTQPEIKKEVEEKSETETQKPKDLPETKSQLASIGEQIPKSSKIFLIALGLAIFSGVIILFLKMKLKIS